MSKSFYRPEIDGLRALAVMSVILYHFNVPYFSGGFVGVDVFFVISGFLITSIIYRDIKVKRFSFANFFERRIRRIFPALFTVLIFTTIFVYKLFLIEDDMSDYGKSLVAQGLFLSNIFFMRREGYFLTPEESSPLLHTWSLAIEEQFYLFFPAVLVLSYKFFKGSIFWVLVAFFVVSFSMNYYFLYTVPGNLFAIPYLPQEIWGKATTFSDAGFYLIFTRAWELLVGAILAVSTRAIVSRVKAEIIGFLGISLILWSVFIYSHDTTFPGFAALLPCLGTAAVIAANLQGKTVVGRILSLRLLVWVGLISYSLYLWHWPVFTFGNILFGELGGFVSAGLIMFSILLAYITYILVEVPIRKTKKLSQSRVFISAATAIASVIFVGHLTKNFETFDNVPLYAQKISLAAEDVGPRHNECVENINLLNDQPCTLGNLNESVPVSFILWGDSHANVMLDTVDSAAGELGVKGKFFSEKGCVPIVGVSRSPEREKCQKVKEKVVDYVQKNKISNLLLISRWDGYINDGVKPLYLIDEQNKKASEQVSREVFSRNLTDMIKYFDEQGVYVYILKQVPENKHFDYRKLFYESIRQGSTALTQPINLYEHREYSLYSDEVFLYLEQNYSNVEIIDPTEILCDETECLANANGTSIYVDNDHLTHSGATLLKPLFLDVINKFK